MHWCLWQLSFGKAQAALLQMKFSYSCTDICHPRSALTPVSLHLHRRQYSQLVSKARLGAKDVAA